jgi:hypothetical protein
MRPVPSKKSEARQSLWWKGGEPLPLVEAHLSFAVSSQAELRLIQSEFPSGSGHSGDSDPTSLCVPPFPGHRCPPQRRREVEAGAQDGRPRAATSQLCDVGQVTAPFGPAGPVP